MNELTKLAAQKADYTVICYRENGEDTCRGQVMERYASDLQLLAESSLPAIALAWATFEIRANQERGPSYEYTLLINGVEHEYTEEYYTVRNAVELQVEAAQAELDRQKKEQEQRAEQLRTQQRLKLQREQRAKDLAELARLKGIYEGGAK